MSLRTVQNWGAAGWIALHPDGSIDLAATAAHVEAGRDPDRGGKPDRAECADWTLAEARRRKEVALARLRELDAEKAEGKLIDAEAAARAWETNGVEVRTAILATAPRLAPAIVGMTDVVAVEAAITRELTQALTALADDMPTGKA